MFRRQFLRVSSLAFPSVYLMGCGGGGGESVPASNAYVQTNLVANSPAYAPQILEPNLVDAWGLAIRPAGAGGHFWVTGMATSFEYVGDVNGKPLYVDDLKTVDLPKLGEDGGKGNGVVFNSSADFVITQAHANGAITAPAKFIFVSDNGVISAWTERSVAGGKVDRPQEALKVVDYSDKNSSFFGLAISPKQDQLFVVDFGANPLPQLRIFNSRFVEEPLNGRFANPFVGTQGFQIGDLVPFNVHTLTYGNTTSVFVAYVNTQEDPDNPGQLLQAVESSGRGRGRLVEYTVQGQLVAVWDDRGALNGPWGMVVAPGNFGAFSGQLLVGNFSDGTIVGFDTQTRKATGYLRDTKGQVVKIQGLWDLLFGNGASLGDANALYFAAGPNGELDGLFGSLRFVG
jgi:uncharacterized protein (TIGR03118 family)